jgi:hypothetical protein
MGFDSQDTNEAALDYKSVLDNPIYLAALLF